MGWWAAPEDETVAGVDITWGYGGVDAAEEDAIKDQAGEGWGEEVCFLLGVAGLAVGGVLFLDKGLETVNWGTRIDYE